jgi:predicted nucleic acid-binding protein
MSKTTNYAWDSSVVIAWLCEEETAPLEDIEAVVTEVDAGKANLIFSVTTYCEILESKYEQEQLDQLDRFLLRSNVRKYDTTIPISKKVARIRDAGVKDGRKIKTPDATIIAVAIMFGADVLHSQGQRTKNVKMGNLASSADLAFH